MSRETLIADALCQPSDAIAYFVSRELAALLPNKGVVEADSCPFGVEKFAAEGLCALQLSSQTHSRKETQWQGAEYPLWTSVDAGWYAAQSLEIVLLSWVEGWSRKGFCWIVADMVETAEAFYRTVCEWNAETRGEVLVFESGGWAKSSELFEAIQSATFDMLILPEPLKTEIQTDFAQFFGARSVYEQYRIPWKRGVLLLGTPGNGKTHTVKALINQSRQPCLYVKSFKSEYDTDHDNIRKVFQRARQTTPCILVLEDLDSLIDDSNRAFFLNEMDGFAANTGIVTLATTNHPERLDSAILERPSRFDRKYYFALPAAQERQRFLAHWNAGLEPAMQISDPALAEVVERTEGYSFAYLKELWLSAMMRWIAVPEPGTMDTVLMAQIDLLRAQMQAEPSEAVSMEAAPGSSAAFAATYARQFMRRRRG